MYIFQNDTCVRCRHENISDKEEKISQDKTKILRNNLNIQICDAQKQWKNKL